MGGKKEKYTETFSNTTDHEFPHCR